MQRERAIAGLTVVRVGHGGRRTGREGAAGPDLSTAWTWDLDVAPPAVLTGLGARLSATLVPVRDSRLMVPRLRPGVPAGGRPSDNHEVRVRSEAQLTDL